MISPSTKECYELMLKMEMFDHIAAHSIMVQTVALCITDKLIEKGVMLNRNIISSAALLHDITKTRSFKTGEYHDVTGGLLLNELGYPAVGDVIRQHVELAHYYEMPPLYEAEIVNYSDKRVLNDKVVPLRTRIDYILKNYGKSSSIKEKITEVGEKTGNLESKIFKFMFFSPDELNRYIDLKAFEKGVFNYKKKGEQHNADRNK